MKIITWNCNMAFRKKVNMVLQYQPDLLVIPECEHADKIIFPRPPTSAIWYGDNPHKGVGVFSFGNYKLELLGCYDPSFKTILPIAVSGDNINFTLFAIWANNPHDKGNQYIGQIWKAIHHYQHLIKPTRTILIGDFNSNSIWDKPRRVGNHTHVVEKLGSKQIKSVYHHHFDQVHGSEEQPTFNLYKNPNKPYHIDYCFVSEDILLKLASVKIGSYNQWREYSDHLPLIVDFSF